MVRRPGVIAPLTGRSLDRLEALTLRLDVAPTTADWTALSSIVAPRLSQLRLHVGPNTASTTVESFLASPWATQLRTLDLVVRSPEQVEALVGRADGLRSCAVSVAMPDALLFTHREQLRTLLPTARIGPIHFATYLSDIEVRPTMSQQPRRAPENFRSLPPKVTVPTEPDVTRTVGSGVRLAGEARLDDLDRCAACASDDTWLIFAETASFYAESESSTVSEFEYECRSCGAFSHYRR